MKSKFILILFGTYFFSCQSNVSTWIEVAEFPISQEAVITVKLTDSVILAPESIFIMNDQLWIFQPKKKILFDVFDITDYKYLFSIGQKGQGPDDFNFPIGQTIQAGSDYFTILDWNVMKTIELQSGPSLHTVKSQKIFDQHVVNGFIRLNDSLFCSFADCFMNTNSDFEYQMKNIDYNSDFKFSLYPENLARKKFEQDVRCQVFYKYLVANPEKKKFAAFYSNYKFFRIYSYNRVLEKEILVTIPPKQISEVENYDERELFYSLPCATEHYIYAYCYSNKEIQVWDWDGNPIIVYKLDEDYYLYTVSENHKKMYLLSSDEDDLNKIFVFDLSHIN